jgi:hypothetical protein
MAADRAEQPTGPVSTNAEERNGMKPSLIAAVLFAAVSTPATAHISYTGRDFGSYTGTDISSIISNQVVTGNFGWADAADGNLGDSHKARAFRFHLDSSAWVTLSVAANPTATATSIGGLLPGFSLYQGLAAIPPFAPPQTSADHDFSAASEAWRTSWAQANLGAGLDFNATDGNWNALGDWKIGGDGDPAGVDAALTSFSFIGAAASTTGSVARSFHLSAGDYSVFIGGNDLANKVSPDAGKAFGLTATLSVTAVPEPQTYALLLAGLTAVGALVRRRRMAG